MFDLITAGEAFEDFVFHGLADLPGPGEEVKTSSFARSPGGGALISAVAAARLGCRCATIAGLGTDAVRLLRREGVSVRNVRRPTEPVAITMAISNEGDRRFVTFTGMNDRLPLRIRRLLARIRARHVHLALHPGRCGPWVATLARLRRRGTATSWDFGWNPSLMRDPDLTALMDGVDYIMFNGDEAMLYGGQPTLRRAIDRWRRARKPVVIKLGADGSRIVGGGYDLRARPHRVRAIDTTGAGDAFNAGFLAALLRGRDLETALAVGNRVGALSTRAAGGIAALPRRSEALRTLRWSG
jgi:ribokinase